MLLSAIEKLDERFPGLEAQVGVWFGQGIGVRKVVELLRAKYQVSVPRATLGNFRARRWAPRHEALRQKLRAVREREARPTLQILHNDGHVAPARFAEPLCFGRKAPDADLFASCTAQGWEKTQTLKSGAAPPRLEGAV